MKRLFRSVREGNAISMAKILDGEYCGVCHGAVSFPLTECDRCHSIVAAPTLSAEQWCGGAERMKRLLKSKRLALLLLVVLPIMRGLGRVRRCRNQRAGKG